MSSLHDMEMLSVLKELRTLLKKLNKLADDEIAKRGISQKGA